MSSADRAIRLVASGRPLNEAMGVLGLQALPVLGKPQGTLSEEGWVKLVSMDPTRSLISVDLQGARYEYTVPPEVYSKFDKMWNVYGAGGKAINWLKAQPGVTFKKASEGALSGLKGKG